MELQSILFLILAGGLLLAMGAATHFSGNGSLNNIKSKTVGDGQHGTARWATKKEIRQTYRHVPFRPQKWRQGEALPQVQGLVLGCAGGNPMKKRFDPPLKKKYSPQSNEKMAHNQLNQRTGKERRPIMALIDSDDIHCLMIGASGVGKTAFFLYPMRV